MYVLVRLLDGISVTVVILRGENSSSTGRLFKGRGSKYFIGWILGGVNDLFLMKLTFFYAVTVYFHFRISKIIFSHYFLLFL